MMARFLSGILILSPLINQKQNKNNFLDPCMIGVDKVNDFLTDMGILDADSILEDIKHDNLAAHDDAISKTCKATEVL